MFAGAWASPMPVAGEAVVVLSREAEPFRKCEKAVTSALKEAGWSVKSVVLDPDGKAAGAESASKVLAIGTEAATWAKPRAKDGAEVVFCMVADAEGAGLIDQPRIGGVLSEVPASDQMALIKETLPKATTVGILYKSGSARGERWLTAMREEAVKRGMVVDAQGVEGKEELGSALSALLKRRVDVLWTMPDGGLYDANTIKAVLHATLEARVPVFGFSTPIVRAGALVGVGITPESQGAQAAGLMIERAEPGGEARVTNPRYEISVNKVVAERLGLTLPAGVIERAVNVYKGD